LSDITIILDGGGAVLTPGLKAYFFIDYACTIKQATMLADQTGSAIVDIFACTYAQYDAGATHPVSADKITSTTPPTISSATKSQDSTLTSWSTAITAGTVLAFNVNSATTITRVSLNLKVAR
jgi:hypothetical protein